MRKLRNKLLIVGSIKSGKSYSCMIYLIKRYLKLELGFKWYFMTRKKKNLMISDIYNSLF